MILWKHSLDTLNEEKATAEKKKQALNDLLSTGKISQSTHDMFSMETAEALSEIEKREKSLLQKVNAKIAELGEQVKTLEILLADFEIQHVTGEIDEETYQREINVLSMGLETSRSELILVKEVADQLVNGSSLMKQENEPWSPETVTAGEQMQQPEVDLESNKASSTMASQTELHSAEAAESAQQPVEAKDNQKA